MYRNIDTPSTSNLAEFRRMANEDLPPPSQKTAPTRKRSAQEDGARLPLGGFGIVEAPEHADQDTSSKKYPQWIRLGVFLVAAIGAWLLVYFGLSLI